MDISDCFWLFYASKYMKGQIVSDKYDRIGNFHRGYASVCLNKLWGAIDLQNRVVVPLEWQGVAPIVNPQLIWVKRITCITFMMGCKSLFV